MKILLLPFVAVIAIGLPLFILYWSLRVGITTLRFLWLCYRKNVPLVVRRMRVAVMVPGLGYQAPEHHHETSHGPTSLDPPAHWEGSHHEFDW